VKPVPAVSTNADTTNPGTDRLLVITITTNDAAAMMSNTEPSRNIVPTPRCTASHEMMRLARTIAEAAAAKLRGYGSCPMPSIDWPTKRHASITDTTADNAQQKLLLHKQKPGLVRMVKIDLYAPNTEPWARWSRGNDSGTATTDSNPTMTAISANTARTPRQSSTSAMRPPTGGARSGPRPMTVAIRLKA